MIKALGGDKHHIPHTNVKKLLCEHGLIAHKRWDLNVFLNKQCKYDNYSNLCFEDSISCRL